MARKTHDGLADDTVSDRPRARPESAPVADPALDGVSDDAVLARLPLASVLEAMPDAVSVYHPSGRAIFLNSAARRLFDGDGAHLRPRDARGRLLPLERWYVARLLRGETITSDQPAEAHISQPHGHTRYISVTGAPIISPEGAVLGAIAIARDVTDLHTLKHRTQESLEALLEMAEAAVTVTAPGGSATSVRGVGMRLIELSRRVLGCQRIAIAVSDPETGVIRPLAAVGMRAGEVRRWLAGLTGAPRPGAGATLAPEPTILRRLRTGEAQVFDLRGPRFRAVSSDFGARTALVSPMLIAERLVGYIALDYSDEPHEFTPEELDLASAVSKLAALVIDRDRILRERSAAEAQLLALEQANQRMNEFLGIAAHELRTPITVIKANLQMLSRRSATISERVATSERLVVETSRLERYTELLARTEKSLTRLTRLVDDMLDVSRVRAGKLEMRIEQVDLADITRDAVEEQRIAEPGRTIMLEALVSGPLPVCGDAERLEQVVTNYLTNALKYSTDTAPVRVRLWRDGARYYVGVTDEGPGIPPEFQAQVWELFQRAPGIEVVSGSGIGLGLGLHLCKTLIERQGGQVGVASEPGQGSTFWLSLPRCDETPVSDGASRPDDERSDPHDLT